MSRNALAAGSSRPTSPLALQTFSSSSLQSPASRLLLVPIEDVPLGARVPTKNPRPWEYDDSLPEPDQATWAKLSITMYRTDGGIVDAELTRPRSWIKSVGIEAGKLLPMNIEELQVKGSALVTAIDDCPEIAGSSQPAALARELSSVITARLCTREVHTVARVEILSSNGQIEVLEGTSEDRQEFIPLGELLPNETLRASDGPAAVLSITILTTSIPVYNIEVHGEHVYQVGQLGVVVQVESASKLSESASQLAEQSSNTRDRSIALVRLDELRDALQIKPSPTGSRCSDLGFLNMSARDYIELLDWTARVVVSGKRCSTPPDAPPIFERLQLGISSESWCELIKNFGKLFSTVAGKPHIVEHYRSAKRKQKFMLKPEAQQLLSV